MKTALSIPIIAAFTLVLMYYAITNDWQVVNKLAYFYFMFSGTLCLNKYMYSYFKSTPNGAKYDYHVPFFQRFNYFHMNMTLLELFTMLLSCYFTFLYRSFQGGVVNLYWDLRSTVFSGYLSLMAIHFSSS